MNVEAVVIEAPRARWSPLRHLGPLGRRRWAVFRANKRGYWSLWLFLALYVLSLCSELIANDKPILMTYRGAVYAPVQQTMIVPAMPVATPARLSRPWTKSVGIPCTFTRRTL